MSDPKSKTSKSEDAGPLRAGVEKEVEREAKADAKEHFEDEAVAEIAVIEPEVELLAELPEDGAVVSAQEELAATAIQGEQSFGRVFEDNFTGKGGSFVIDAKTGERKRQYEAVRDTKGKTLGYRPAV